ncbi:MAG: dTMP kinase [Gammaproteobacteria bacterium]|nr:dTMP kinase [Gammaproteobacteria bacterium]
MQRGKFITIEGIEGVGKSTNIAHLIKAIEARGHAVLTTREPGGTPMAERIRELVAEHGNEPVPDVAELLLVFASRALHVNNVIEPALAAGTWVICDRFTDSSRAYQGGGRGLPIAQVNTLADWVHGDLSPDLTILLDAPVETGMRRAGNRSEPDRFESEQAEFFTRVRQTYLQLAQDEPQRIALVDAAQDRQAVQDRVEVIINTLLDKVSS